MRRFLSTALTFGAFLCLAQIVDNAQADLINPMVNDNKPLLFRATVDDTALGFAAIVVGGADPMGFAGNWSVEVKQLTLDLIGLNNDIQVQGFHNIAPHPRAREFPVNPGPVLILFNVVPGGAAVGVAGAVGHGRIHMDTYDIAYAPLMGGGSRLFIEARHPVPHPPTLLFLGSALAVLVGFGRNRLPKRRNAGRNPK